ncbi:MAG: SagB/ThcOx family dehydrogenase [Candidatus Aenigmarchaeota archaeon]|nr:SagB/ThcOx family dehydrogenase [Candidatus Aenigmarchaeota archaeon]
MIKDIEDFYKKTKLHVENKGPVSANSEQPITHTHVFYKSYPRFPSIKLPETSLLELDKLLETRESFRNFSNKPLSIEQVASIILSCRIVDKNRVPERRTYPSGGARFPIEIYLISFNIDGLQKGAYHYNMAERSLEILLETDLRHFENEIVSDYLRNTSAAIVLTSVLARSEVKYGVKAYPYSLLEAGHMAQNILLACTELGIGCCPVGGFLNDKISEILDLTPHEIPIYAIGIGKKKG